MKLVERIDRLRSRVTGRVAYSPNAITDESPAVVLGADPSTENAAQQETQTDQPEIQAESVRALVISDVHANLVALEAVLRDVKQREINYDTVWCLGDVVGYGPQPNECIELLRTLNPVCLAGNHDWAVLGKLDLDTFHENAAYVVRWTREHLTIPNYEYLQALPAEDERGEFHIAHASPREPIWEYIIDVNVAEDNFGLFNTPYCLVGHTHVPVLFVKDTKANVRASYPNFGVPISLKPNFRYIINPGSVGQPRDGDARAAYAVLDTETRTWTPYRVEYDIQATQAKMRALKIPSRLIDRLEFGR